MKILVISDSHGKKDYVYCIVGENMDADVVIHLGDGPDDVNFEQVRDMTMIRVKGNCDYFSCLPLQTIKDIGGYKFFITHGHEFKVKQSLREYHMASQIMECNVALYGHTHIPFYEERAGVHLFNPGAVRDGSYGVIEIDENNISFKHCEI